MDELNDYDIINPTEVKFENTINRITAVAKPRQIERVISGSKFKLEILYNMEDFEEAKEDFTYLYEALKMLEYDYLGGHGSRGYGRVKVSGLKAESMISSTDVMPLNEILKGV